MKRSKQIADSKRSDVAAKLAFAKIFRKRGFDPVEVTSKPADLTATEEKRNITLR